MNMTEALQAELANVAETAGYLWQKGWAERNAGNISINVSNLIDPADADLPAIATYALPRPLPELAGEFFYVTGTGRRMRDVAKAPLRQGAIVRIAPDGLSYDIVADADIKPTSELPSHLCIHRSFKQKGNGYRVVLHTHPTELLAMTHIPELNNTEALTRTLWAMHPETFIVVPKGVGVVRYEVPGSLDLADLTLEQLADHDFVAWEKHGFLGTGKDLLETFDLIDTLGKSAQTYFLCKQAGFEPEGLTDEQIRGLIVPFGIKL
jgi:rhamnulose-1-phosphate aldolase